MYRMNRWPILWTLLTVAALYSGGAIFAADPVGSYSVERLFPGVAFDAEIPTQQSITGVEHGARPVRPNEALAYMKALAEASPRAQWIEYARSYEDRPLGILAVGDEATIASLDAFRKEHGAALDPRVRTKPPEGAAAVAWMAYGIHGDELPRPTRWRQSIP